MHRRWWWVFVPLLLGLVVGLVFILTDAPNPILYAQADLGTWFLELGWDCLFWQLGSCLFLIKLKKSKLKPPSSSLKTAAASYVVWITNLKNPLTAILAGLANLSIAETPSDRSASLSSVQTQVGRLRRLVAELRKLSELETRPLDRGLIDMTDLLEDAFSLAQDHPEADERVLRISIPQAPWPLPSINGDRDLLILAIHNLLDNAIKIHSSGDTIEMRASEDGAGVVIEVADTGPGIPNEDQAHVWEELYRGESARGIPGSGLGLALVRAIVARHEGTITLRSRPGKGTVFTIRLPG